MSHRQEHRAGSILRPILVSSLLLAVTGVAISPDAGAQPADPKPQPAKPQPAKPAPQGDQPSKLKPLPPLKVPAPKPDEPKTPKPADKPKPAPEDKTGPKDAGVKTKRKPVAPLPSRWTEATPDRMATLGIDRARAGGDDALAGLVIAASLDARVVPGDVVKMLANVSKSDSHVADDARMLGLELTPPPFGKPWEGWVKASFDAPPDRTGMVDTFAILGPFQDAGGGGVKRKEGPELEGQTFTDAKATYSWGVYEVAWRRTLPESSTAEGVPLDLYIAPRQEACTYLASKITFAAGVKGPVTAHVASTGSVRLIWDGASVGFDEDVHQRALFDRMAAKLQPEEGNHLLAVKVCSGTQSDDGRVRVRFTDDTGKPLAVQASSDLSGIPADRATSNDEGVALGPPKAAPGKGTPPPAPAKPAAPKKGVAKFERVRTALEDALDVGSAPSRQDALEAAVVRTLAGADDLRSPRAPGLLDRVARDPATTPDELALAGWLSGFGANRSGWLNQARERAQGGNDKLTEAFAQRRIAEAQVATGRDDWALATEEVEPFKSATDVEARVMRVQARLHVTGSTALASMQEIDLQEKQQLPLFALRLLSSLASQKPELSLALTRRIASISSSGRSPAFARAAGIEGAASVERAAAQILASQTTASQLTSLGRELLRLGRDQWAREVLYTATKLSPNSGDAFDALAGAREAVIQDEKNAGKPATDDPAFAEKAERRALALRPTDTRQKDEIAFRTATETPGQKPADKDKAAQDDEKYLVAGSVILDRAKANPAKVGEVFERQLHFMRIVTYHPDKRVSQLIHYAREIVVEPRTDDELYERELPVEGDEAELVFARLYHKDGTVSQPDEQSSGGNPYVKWPELKRGDIVEVAVRSWTSGPVGRRGDAPFYFIDYVGSTETKPVLFNEVIVDSPTDSPLAVDVVNGKAERVEDTSDNGRKVVKLIWEHPPSVPDEPMAPKPTEVLPIVVGSTYKGWDEFREWYRAAIQGFSDPDDEIRQLAADLTKGKTSQKDKLDAIFNFVADDIRYVNYVSSEQWLPNRPQQLLARRQGDCDDKATLLISLLRAIGVEATPVLVQTRLTAMPSVLASTKVAVPMFDHGIAFLPGKNGQPGTWLDATSPQSRIGPLPSMDARARALFIFQGDAKIIETPPSSPDENGSDIKWTVKLSPKGSADIIGKEKHVGDWAFELRNFLIEKDARAQWVEGYLGSRLPTVALSGEVDYSPDAGTLGYTVHSDGYARREGEELVVTIAGSGSYTSSYAPLIKRTLPVSLPPNAAPSHQTRTVTVTAPDGFQFAELPPDGEQKGGSFGSAKITFKQNGDKRSVEIVSSMIFDKSIIPVSEYAAFRQWLQSVDGMMRSQVRLVPIAAPVKAAKP